MKANELMIGDWVKVVDDDTDDNFIGQVKAIDELGNVNVPEGEDVAYPYSIDCLEPIPLIPEILEKNTDGGFCDFKDPIIGYEGKRSLYWIGKVGIYVEWERMIGVPYVEFQGLADTFFKGYIKSLHELQHALRLCGIEKEITL